MASIADNITYVNFTKFSEFNETFPTIEISDFSTIMTEILNVFVTYDILQWFLSILVFVAVFMMIRKETFLNLTDTQVLTISCLIVISMNALLLFFNIWSILQPIQFFFVVWLIGILFIFGK